MKYLLPILLFSLPVFVRAAEVDCTNIPDPAGDLEIWNATSTGVRATERADIRGASMKITDDAWMFSVAMASLPETSQKEKANLLILLDVDGVKENNYWRPTNGRAGSDAYYSVFTTGSSTVPWALRRYLYDPSIAKWRKSETDATFVMVGDAISLRIPASEMRERSSVNWRAVMTVGGPDWYARDAAPDKTDDPSACGFLPVPPKPDLDATMSRVSTSTSPAASASFPWVSLFAVAGAVAAISVYSVCETRIRSFVRRKVLRKKP